MASREYDWTSRIQRAFSQRIYLLDAQSASESDFSFKVMGNSGQSYDVSINKDIIECTCPDHTTRGSLCKHLMFVLIRACRIAQEHICENYYHKLEFSTTPSTLEKCAIFMQRREQGLENQRFAPAAPEGRPAKPSKPEVERKPIDDCCPICYEDFEDTKDEPTVWCRYSCGNSLHGRCFDMWAQSLKRKHQQVNCVYCRAKWE
jgi:hypothetical protein